MKRLTIHAIVEGELKTYIDETTEAIEGTTSEAVRYLVEAGYTSYCKSHTIKDVLADQMRNNEKKTKIAVRADYDPALYDMITEVALRYHVTRAQATRMLIATAKAIGA